MATTKLSIYKGALRLLGERSISSLTEDRAARRYLDEAYDDGLIDYVLEQGLWRFATRSIEATASDSVEPDFGLQYAFDKPTNYIRTAGIYSDEYMQAPYMQYKDEASYWFADIDVLYIAYVSNDSSYGADMSLWPQTFVKFVQAELADRVKELITGNDGKYERIKHALKQARTDARSKDVMNDAPRFAPSGTWVKSRMNSAVNNNKYR